MSVTAKMYSHLPLNLLMDKLCDFDSETKIKCLLLKNTYTPVQDDHDFKDDLVCASNEVEGTGYTAGGVILTTTAPSVLAKVTTFDADDVEWADATITARYAVLYDDTEAAEADQPVICYIDFGEDKSSEAGTFKIAWNASGIFTITVP